MTEIKLSQADLARLKIKTKIDLDLYGESLNAERQRQMKPHVRVQTDVPLPGHSLLMDRYMAYEKKKKEWQK